MCSAAPHSWLTGLGGRKERSQSGSPATETLLHFLSQEELLIGSMCITIVFACVCVTSVGVCVTIVFVSTDCVGVCVCVCNEYVCVCVCVTFICVCVRV